MRRSKVRVLPSELQKVTPSEQRSEARRCRGFVLRTVLQPGRYGTVRSGWFDLRKSEFLAELKEIAERNDMRRNVPA